MGVVNLQEGPERLMRIFILFRQILEFEVVVSKTPFQAGRFEDILNGDSGHDGRIDVTGNPISAVKNQLFAVISANDPGSDPMIFLSGNVCGVAGVWRGIREPRAGRETADTPVAPAKTQRDPATGGRVGAVPVGHQDYQPRQRPPAAARQGFGE